MSNLNYVKYVACNWAEETIRIGSSLTSLHTDRIRSSLDEHFFLTSATMLNKSCNYIRDNSTDTSETSAAKAFIEITADARDIRNKREHFENYIDGNSKKQSEFTAVRGGTMADSTSTIVDEHGYHLGNRATVQTIIAACEDFLKSVKRPW